MWHERLGHQHNNYVKEILNKSEIYTDNKETFCELCVFGKYSRKPFFITNTKITEPEKIIHSDVWEPMEECSIGESHYFILFKDNFSHYRRVYSLKQKNEVKNVLEEFIKSVKIDTGKK